MPLKIVHHKESRAETKKDKLSLNIETLLTKMFTFCESVVNASNLVIEETEKFYRLQNSIISNKEEKKICCKNGYDFDNVCVEGHKNIEDNEDVVKAMNLFALVAGKKSSPLDAMSKTASIIQKIDVLADNFGVSLSNKADEETDVLTDEDIDVMVQMVKDFGEKQIREDAKECCEKVAAQKSLEEKKKTSTMDVYDVYHKN